MFLSRWKVEKAPRIKICTISGKINCTPKGIYLPISKQHSILAVPNLLAHNSITVSYIVQVDFLHLKSNVASKWASIHIYRGTIYFAVYGIYRLFFIKCAGIQDSYPIVSACAMLSPVVVVCNTCKRFITNY